jgi:hypothetical protein
MIDLRGWELHIVGHGLLANEIRALAHGNSSIVLRGLLDRREFGRFLKQTTIGMNPHDLSEMPGNVFAFKIIDYLAAGNHVITTPMGPLEPEIEQGLTYIPDNTPRTIAATLERVIKEGLFKQTAAEPVKRSYGSASVAKSLDLLLAEVRRNFAKRAAEFLPASERN